MTHDNGASDNPRYVNARKLSNPERSTLILALEQFAETREYTVAKSDRHRAILNANVATARELAGWIGATYPVYLTGSEGES